MTNVSTGSGTPCGGNSTATTCSAIRCRASDANTKPSESLTYDAVSRLTSTAVNLTPGAAGKEPLLERNRQRAVEVGRRQLQLCASRLAVAARGDQHQRRLDLNELQRQPACLGRIGADYVRGSSTSEGGSRNSPQWACIKRDQALVRANRPAHRVRAKSKFACDLRLIWVVQPFPQKYSA